MSPSPNNPSTPVRRRASRAAGPAKGNAEVASQLVLPAAKLSKGLDRPLGRLPRRPANRRLVLFVGLAFGVIATVVLSAMVALLSIQQTHAQAERVRNQRFVDTAMQTVVNMFSFTQDTIDNSVDRFVSGTSGPLRDMLSQENNVENLKAMFRDTKANSEAVVNGAALEAVDNVADNASVLVAVRVTVTDIDGVNKPSQTYRMRVIVREDESGRMTGYDLKYPDGGN